MLMKQIAIRLITSLDENKGVQRQRPIKFEVVKMKN